MTFEEIDELPDGSATSEKPTVYTINYTIRNSRNDVVGSTSLKSIGTDMTVPLVGAEMIIQTRDLEDFDVTVRSIKHWITYDRDGKQYYVTHSVNVTPTPRVTEKSIR